MKNIMNNTFEHLAADNENNKHDVAPVRENDEDYRINMLIREKYSLSQEISLLRKIHIGEASEEEFLEYSNYVKECIEKAREI